MMSVVWLTMIPMILFCLAFVGFAITAGIFTFILKGKVKRLEERLANLENAQNKQG